MATMKICDRDGGEMTLEYRPGDAMNGSGNLMWWCRKGNHQMFLDEEERKRFEPPTPDPRLGL